MIIMTPAITKILGIPLYDASTIVAAFITITEIIVFAIYNPFDSVLNLYFSSFFLPK